MAFSAPVAFVAGAILLASQMEQIRRSLNADVVAVVTTAGDLGYASSAGQMARLGMPSASGNALQSINGLPVWQPFVTTATGESRTDLAKDTRLITWGVMRGLV